MASHFVILSPHSDDAALSIPGTIDLLAAASASVTVLTCFSKSGYAPYVTGQPTVDQITRIREQEDAEFACKIGCQAASLGLFDTGLRVPGRSLYDPTRVQSDEIGALRAAAALPCRQGWVLAPLGLGNHVDHVLCAHFGATARTHRLLAFYEDVPYLFNLDQRDVNDRVSAVERVMKTRLNRLSVFHSSRTNIWLRGISGYRSQLSAQDIENILKNVRNSLHEFLWSPLTRAQFNSATELCI